MSSKKERKKEEAATCHYITWEVHSESAVDKCSTDVTGHLTNWSETSPPIHPPHFSWEVTKWGRTTVHQQKTKCTGKHCLSSWSLVGSTKMHRQYDMLELLPNPMTINNPPTEEFQTTAMRYKLQDTFKWLKSYIYLFCSCNMSFQLLVINVTIMLCQ